MATPDSSCGGTGRKGLQTQVVRGSGWIYGRRLVTTSFNLFVIALLARRLQAADFGTLAIALTILELLTTLGPVGVGDFVVCDRTRDAAERVHAAFWLNMTLTATAVVVCAPLVPLLGHFYQMPVLVPVLYVLLLQFAIGQIGAIPDALLRRELNFKSLALREAGLEILNGAGKVTLAVSGFGVWSLIVPSLLLAPVSVYIAFRLTGWYPKLPLRVAQWKTVAKFSGHCMGTNLVTLIANEGDTLLVGKLFGPTDLGFYNQAWLTANIVKRQVSGVVTKVAMPALSAVSSDLKRLSAVLNKMLRLLSLLCFPLLLGLLLVADLYVRTVYGPKWENSILPLQILIIYALRQTIGSPATTVYNVTGRPDIGFKMGLAFLPFYVMSIWLGSHYGIVGVAAGVTIARTSFGMVQFAVVARLVGQTFGEMLRNFKQPAFAAGLFMLILIGCRILFSAFGASGPLLLALLVAAGGLVWLLLLTRLYPNLLDEILEVLDQLPTQPGRKLKRVLAPILA